MLEKGAALPLAPQLDLPALGRVRIVEQFAGPHGFGLFAGAMISGAYAVGYRAGRDRRHDIWLIGATGLQPLLDLLCGRLPVRDLLAASPGGRLARLAVAGNWPDAIADLLPVAAVAEEMPPPCLTVDRRWMKAGHPWFLPAPPASPRLPPTDAAPARAEGPVRKPAAGSHSRRPAARIRVWLADGTRRG